MLAIILKPLYELIESLYLEIPLFFFFLGGGDCIHISFWKVLLAAKTIPTDRMRPDIHQSDMPDRNLA
jgi:hypothetical protein